MIDLYISLAISGVLVVALLSLLILKSRVSEEERLLNERIAAERPQEQEQRQVPRRAQVQRGVRNRRVPGRQDDSDDDVDERRQAADADNVEEAAEELFGDAKVGAKKRAKMEAKAEKKAQREAEQREREEKKKRDALLEAEREKEQEAAKAEEQKRIDAEKKALEEKEKREYEEYLKMKEAFSVEAEGFEEEDEDDVENSVRNFVEYIKDSKVVVLEDVALRFKLKTQSVIDRITQLQDDGILTGVVDDRGKFIFVSRDELEGVAKFIRQRGRVSIADLATASDSLINLTPAQAVGL